MSLRTLSLFSPKVQSPRIILHVLRTEMEAVTWQGWSLRRMRERVLKAGAHLLTHARRITVVIERRAADLWRRL